MKKIFSKNFTNILILTALLVISIILTNLNEDSIGFKVLSYISITALSICIIVNVITSIYKSKYELKSIEMFNGFISYLDEAIILYDKRHKKYYISNKIRDIYAVSDEEIMNGPLYDTNNIDIHKHFKNKLSQNDNEIIETTILNKENNKTYYIRIVNKIIKFERITLNCIIINDITKSKNDENTFISKLDDMKEEIVMRNNFLSRVSHEIRTPLNGIIGMTDIAKNDLNNHNAKACYDALNNIDSSSKYLLDIVNNILNIRSIESGNIKFNYQEFDLTKILDETKTILYPQITHKKLSFDISRNFEHLFLYSDSTKIVQILVNIIANSIKYTNEKGHIKLNITYKDVSVNKCLLVFKIEDNGIGMSEEFAKIMFEPFAVENKVTNVSSTGLGLPIAKSLIDLLDGKVKVDSKEGVGTTTSISLVCQKASKIKPKETKTNKVYDYSKYRILVAEDNNINRLVIKAHLESFNFKVDIASDGVECLNLFKESQVNYYDLILMDIHMPLMDGFETTTNIRELERADANIPIIALTADVLDKDINKALLNEMNNFISKPIIKEDMIKVINTELKLD